MTPLSKASFKRKSKEWLRRYLPAEIIATLLATLGAFITFLTTHSFVSAAALGWCLEGIGFYGYFIFLESCHLHHSAHSSLLGESIRNGIRHASSSLAIEFLPAELIDNFLIRPFFMFLFPQFIHPYILGFLIAKLSADVIFYSMAIIGYEYSKKRNIKNT